MGTARLFLGTPTTFFQTPICRRGNILITCARKQNKKNRKERRPQQDEGPDPVTTRIVIENLEQELPSAPPPGGRTHRQQEVSPEEFYPVFAPKPGTATNAPWRWDDDGDERDRSAESASSGAEEETQLAWNPRTGFMRSAAQEVGTSGSGSNPAEGSAAPSSSSPPSSVPYTRAGARSIEVSLTVPPAEALPPGPSRAGTSGDSPGSSPPPPVMPASRKAVLTSALSTGVWMAALAVVFRNYAALGGAQAMGTDPAAVAALLRWPAGLESLSDVGVAVGAAAVVTGARLALLSVWRDLREATDRSNQQVLTLLSPGDILLVALVSGVPEELLFRGALVPATFPDWRGVLLAAAIFGALHNSGGRNPAFAVWAGGVGAVYGAAYLATGNVWVPALAHAAANAVSAFAWKARGEATVATGEVVAGTGKEQEGTEGKFSGKSGQ